MTRPVSVEMPAEGLTIGVISDTHLCSVTHRRDVLEAAYKTYNARGITHVFHAGNIVDGVDKKKNLHEVTTVSIDGQVAVVINDYPKLKTGSTYYICGDDHEGWLKQKDGIDFGAMLEAAARDAGRTDLTYLGYGEADVTLRRPHAPGCRMRICHPGGGSAKSISNEPQKIIDAYDDDDRPDILVIGHFHKAGHFVWRGVQTLMPGCTQGQSMWMRKKSLRSTLGYYVVTLQVDARGKLTRFAPEWHPGY